MTSKPAAGVLYLIAIGQAGFDLSAGFTSSGFGEHSPGKYGFGAALVTVLVMTFMFLIVILGSTHKRASPSFAGLAIGLALTLIHLISISVTNTSVNPAAARGRRCSSAAGRSSSCVCSGWRRSAARWSPATRGGRSSRGNP